MLTCVRNRQGDRRTDRRREGFWSRAVYSRFWHCLFGRSDRWRKVGRPTRSPAKQLLRTDGNQDEPGLRGPRVGEWWNGVQQRNAPSLILLGLILCIGGMSSCALQ